MVDGQLKKPHEIIEHNSNEQCNIVHGAAGTLPALAGANNKVPGDVFCLHRCCVELCWFGTFQACTSDLKFLWEIVHFLRMYT